MPSKFRISPWLIALLLAIGIPHARAQSGPAPAAEAGVAVHVDTRVELATILARLAGFEEYQAPGIAAYDRAVEAHFGRFRDHAAVALLKQLREQRGIAYNAPIELALAAEAGSWKPAVRLSPWPAFLDRRWDEASARAFLAAAARFERDSDSGAFFATQRPLYAEVEAVVAGNLGRRLDPAWYRTQAPTRGSPSFTVVPALLAGPNSYGPHLRYADGREAVFGVLATPAHREGQAIAYPADAQLALLAHEFHHPSMNAWADAQAATLLPAAEVLFDAVRPRMEALAYGEARIMLYETLVRANTLRYLRRHGETAVLRRAMAEDQEKGFPWTPALADLFDALERDGGIAFDAGTAKRVAAFLQDWGRDKGAKVAAEQVRIAEAKLARLATGPQLERYVPAQGSLVAADLTMLELHFDRPMAPGLAIFGETPEITGKPSWDESRRVLRLPVRLEPGARYTLQLNNEDTLRMQSADGEPLVPRQWSFRVEPAVE